MSLTPPRVISEPQDSVPYQAEKKDEQSNQNLYKGSAAALLLFVLQTDTRWQIIILHTPAFPPP